MPKVGATIKADTPGVKPVLATRDELQKLVSTLNRRSTRRFASPTTGVSDDDRMVADARNVRKGGKHS